MGMSAVLPLTTLARLMDHIEIVSASQQRPVTRAALGRILATVSKQINEYCDADLAVAPHVERLAVTPGQRALFVSHPAIQSVTYLKYDPMGVFQDGTYNELTEGTDFTIDPDDRRRINLMVDWPIEYNLPTNIFEISYPGGWIYATETTVYNAVATGTVAAGSYDQPDGSTIKILAFDPVAGLLTFQPVVGTFCQGQTIEAGSASLVLGAMVKASVTNDHAALEMAALTQAGYLWERKTSMGRTSTTLGPGETRYEAAYDLLDSVKKWLIPYTVHHA